MALDKGTLKNGIKALLEEMLIRKDSSSDEFAERLSTLIETYVKGAEIKYTGGLVAPPGTGGGPVTGIFNNSKLV